MSHRIINYYPHFIFLCIVTVCFVSLSLITLFDWLSSAATELLCFTYSLCLFTTEFAQLSSVAIDGFAFFPFLEFGPEQGYHFLNTHDGSEKSDQCCHLPLGVFSANFINFCWSHK